MAKPHRSALHGACPDTGRAALSPVVGQWWLCSPWPLLGERQPWSEVFAAVGWLCLAKCLLVLLLGDGFASVTHGLSPCQDARLVGLAFGNRSWVPCEQCPF